MNENHLRHMYQAWQQQNDDYIQDWMAFVQYAATINGSVADIMLKELVKYSWFKTTK